MSESMGLFTRLAAYSQNPAKRNVENFTTEVLAYLINHDRVFRHAFVRHIIRDGRARKRFKHASAQTQQSFDAGIVDLVVSGRGKKVLVEVKIQAAETLTKIYGRGWVSQVRKYLSYREGPVAYLTTRTSESPDVNSRQFLGHFYFEDLYINLSKKRLSLPGKLFVEFMEDNEMKSAEPFSEQDLRMAVKAFSFAKKCEATLDELISSIEPIFRRWFKTRTRFTGGHFSPTYSSSYAWTRNFSRGSVKRVYIYIEPMKGKLCCGVSVRVLREKIKKLNRHLGWAEEQGALWTAHPLGQGVGARGLESQILRDLRALRAALNRTT